MITTLVKTVGRLSVAALSLLALGCAKHVIPGLPAPRCNLDLTTPADPNSIAKRNCTSDARLCIRAEEIEKGVTFYAENYNFSDISLSFGMDGATNINYVGAQPPGNSPWMLVSVPPCKSAKIATMRVERAGVAWSYDYRYQYSLGALNARHNTSARYSNPLPGGSAIALNGGDGSEIPYRISAPIGSPVLAARDGMVAFVREQESIDQSGFPSPNVGNVVIEHNDGTKGEYFYVASISAMAGAQVKAGDQLGILAGSAGNLEPYLHFQVTRVVNDGRGKPHDEFVKVRIAGLPTPQSKRNGKRRYDETVAKPGEYRPVEAYKAPFTSLNQFPIPSGGKITYRNKPLKTDKASVWFETKSSLSKVRSYYLSFFEKRECEVTEDVDNIEHGGMFVLSFKCHPDYEADVRIHGQDRAFTSDQDIRSIVSDFSVSRRRS